MKKSYRTGSWIESLKISDFNQILNELHRVVALHPLARAQRRRTGFLVEEGKLNTYIDLTQELFVCLLEKNRFQHYLDTGMSNVEIEAEISQIELTNILTAEFRKRYPESYRLARRVSTLLQTSKAFKRFDNLKDHDSRLANRQYGLSKWSKEKYRNNVAKEAEEKVKEIPIHKRDLRMVGCTGDSQIIISNPELEKLLVRIFQIIDSPADVRSLRSLAMSRLLVMDVHLISLEPDTDNEDQRSFDFIDTKDTPEEDVLRSEAEISAGKLVEDFLINLNQSVQCKQKQYRRMVDILWYCYLTPDNLTQLEVSEMLGVSDSLVSNYRKRIVLNLRLVGSSFDSLNEAQVFQKALSKKVQQLIGENHEVRVPI